MKQYHLNPNVKEKRKNVYGNVDIGKTFYYLGVLYLKTAISNEVRDATAGFYYSISLETGVGFVPKDQAEIIPVNAKYVILEQ